ncbi:MAG TPA: cupin domain-containing protein, partial [Rhodothermales bacterium]
MVDVPSTLFGGRSPAEFLSEFWQKKPILVRGALPGFQSPISPEELAGLALEEEVSSRIVQPEGGAYPWQLRYGPFEAEEIEELPEAGWSLLVQEVDQWHSEAARVLDYFRFIPNWRIDDLMISYATPGGGVGAHIDNYDVFLIQGMGRRRWEIGLDPVYDEVLVPDIDVRVLADFSPDAEWILEPGDMLYLPPRIPHNGVALDACMTLSVGFRAPSQSELIGGFMGYLAQTMDPTARYADPDLQPTSDPGLLPLEVVESLRRSLLAHVDDAEAFRSWFGCHVTEPKRGSYAVPPDEPWERETLLKALEDGGEMVRRSLGQFVHIDHP